MKRFEQLHINDQTILLAAVLEAVAKAKARGHTGTSIAEVTREIGQSPLQWWNNLCADCGLDRCHPWEGFPEIPKELPPAPGGERPLPDHVIDAFAKLMGPTKQ